MRELVVTLGRRYVHELPAGPGQSWAGGRLNAWLREHPRKAVVSTVAGRMAVDTEDLIQRYLYLFGVWEPHLTRWLRRRLRPGDGLVDVGANIGYVSLLGASLVGPCAHVVALEASPRFHTLLVQQLRLNGANVRAVNAAVSDKDEELTFVLASAANLGANSVVPYEGEALEEFTVQARPLPELLSDEEIAAARVIKIDVEGAEGAVMRGLMPMLPRLREDAEIVVEVTPERMEKLGDDVDELVDGMVGAGYHVYRLPNDYRVESYPRAIRHSRGVATRVRGPVRGQHDLVFSKVDADEV